MNTQEFSPSKYETLNKITATQKYFFRQIILQNFLNETLNKQNKKKKRKKGEVNEIDLCFVKYSQHMKLMTRHSIANFSTRKELTGF